MLRLQNDLTQSFTEMFRMTKGLIKYISFELLHKQLPQMQWLKTISNDQFIFLQVRSSDRLGWPPALGLTRVLSGVNQARPFSGGCGEELASKLLRLFVSRFQFLLPLMVCFLAVNHGPLSLLGVALILSHQFLHLPDSIIIWSPCTYTLNLSDFFFCYQPEKTFRF